MRDPNPALPPGLATPPARPGWRERFLDWRDRCIADPRFRRWAAAFPLTRPLARRSARGLFDLVAGFVYTQVLTACVRLNVFERLAAGPLTLSVLAAQLQLSPEAAQRLLDAAVSLHLLARRRPVDGQPRYGLGPLGAPMVGNPGIAAMVTHHAALYADLRDPVALLRGDTERALNGYWAYASTAAPGALGGAQVDDYSALMAASQPLVAEQILEAYDLSRHRRLMDVGGGEGAFLAQAGRRAPGLALTLFDLPAVVQRAGARLAAAGLADRTQVVGGDFQRDTLPGGADLISLVRVAYDHPDDVVRGLLKSVRAALPADGALLLAEPMAGTPGAEPMGDAYFGFYLLAMGGGRARTAERLTELMHEAGFSRVRLLPTHVPLQTRVLLAQP